MVKPSMNIQIPSRVWVEVHDGGPDACDILVQMEDGTIFTSLFVTPSYIQRQMNLNFDLSKQIPDTIPARFAVLDTPHIVVESLAHEAIEDAIDNLLAMEVFESVFTQVTEGPSAATTGETTHIGRRATQEVAAVVLSDVLVVEESD